MSSAVAKGLNRPSTRVAVYALALGLPVVCLATTLHIAALHPVPLALNFIAVAVIATFAGTAPAMLAVLVTVLARYLTPASLHIATHFDSIEGLRVVTLTASALVISGITRNRRRAAAALEVALAKLQEQTSALIESQQASKCTSWTYDSRDRTRWYPGGYEVFGVPFSELEKLASPIDLIWPEDQPAVRTAVKRMITERGPLHIEYRVLWPNGEMHWSEARGTPLEGNPHVWRGVTFDITERKLAEAALIRSEKLAAIGRLASTIAHEINNPLEAVTNLLYLARGDASLSPVNDEHLATAERELARIGEITRLALGFVRTSAQQREMELVDGIEDVLSIFRHRFEMKNVHLDRRYQPGLVIHIAPQELRQIATNLISNALDATSPPDARVGIFVEQEDDHVVLLVEDNGTGISESHLSRIFDPFFTTKADTGTGIGLWITRELVEKNGGSISVQSGTLPNGVRTAFRVEFPLALIANVATAAESNPAAVS